MLNKTGGGEEKFKRENEIIFLRPKHVFDISPDKGTVKEVLGRCFN
ncbi:hypothetical protein ACFLSE_05895 [Bacteroidota bacterium]